MFPSNNVNGISCKDQFRIQFSRRRLFSHKSEDKTRKLLLFLLTILELLSLLCNFEKRSNGDRMGWSTGMFRSVRWLSSSWFLSLNALDSSQACSIQLTIPNISGINNVSLEDHLDAWAGVVWNIFVWERERERLVTTRVKLPASCCPPSVLSDCNNQPWWQKLNPRQAANWLVPSQWYTDWLPHLLSPASGLSERSADSDKSSECSVCWDLRPPAAIRNPLLTTNSPNLPVVSHSSVSRLPRKCVELARLRCAVHSSVNQASAVWQLNTDW